MAHVKRTGRAAVAAKLELLGYRVDEVDDAIGVQADPPRNHPPMPAYAQGRIEMEDAAPSHKPVDWYSARVWMANGERAWSSPLWLAGE